MASVLEKVLRFGEGRTLRKLQNYAKAVNQLEEDFTHLTDEELKNETVELRERHANGESSTTSSPTPSPRSASRPAVRSASATSTSRSWAARPSTSATSPR